MDEQGAATVGHLITDLIYTLKGVTAWRAAARWRDAVIVSSALKLIPVTDAKPMDDAEGYLADKNPEAAALFRRFQGMALSCGTDVVPSVSRTVVYFKRRRVFAGAFVRGKRLELVIDLLREVDHECLRAAFHTTKRVISHRFTMTKPGELDRSIQELLREAYETVGPGTRRKSGSSP